MARSLTRAIRRLLAVAFDSLARAVHAHADCLAGATYGCPA